VEITTKHNKERQIMNIVIITVALVWLSQPAAAAYRMWQNERPQSTGKSKYPCFVWTLYMDNRER